MCYNHPVFISERSLLQSEHQDLQDSTVLQNSGFYVAPDVQHRILQNCTIFVKFSNVYQLSLHLVTATHVHIFESKMIRSYSRELHAVFSNWVDLTNILWIHLRSFHPWSGLHLAHAEQLQIHLQHVKPYIACNVPSVIFYISDSYNPLWQSIFLHKRWNSVQITSSTCACKLTGGMTHGCLREAGGAVNIY